MYTSGQSVRAKYGVRNENSGSTIGVFRSLLSSTYHQYDRNWNGLEWDIFCLDVGNIFGPFLVSFCWKQFLIEIETCNSRKTHLTHSCVSWHLCVHSCPDPLSWIHSTSSTIHTICTIPLLKYHGFTGKLRRKRSRHWECQLWRAATDRSQAKCSHSIHRQHF